MVDLITSIAQRRAIDLESKREPDSWQEFIQLLLYLLRKEVIHPQIPLRIPCYDLVPIAEFTFGGVLLTVRLPTSGAPNFVGLTGGVYKSRERIHRSLLICDY